MEQEERIAILRSEFGRTTRPLDTTHWDDLDARESVPGREEVAASTPDQTEDRDLQQAAGRGSGIGM